MTPRVTTTKPRRYGSAMDYALHSVIVTVHGATPEQITAADALAASFAGTQRDAARPGRYRVRQALPPQGKRHPIAAGADRDHVVAKADGLAEALRRALAAADGAAAIGRPLVSPWHSAPSVRAGLPTTRAAWLALVLPVVDAAPSHPAVVAALAAAGYVLGRGVAARAIVRGWHDWLVRAQAAGELPERVEPLPTRRAGARPGPDATGARAKGARAANAARAARAAKKDRSDIA